MNEITEKSKFKIKKLPHRIVIDEKKIIDENAIAENSIIFCKYWTKASFKNTSDKYTF